MARWKPAPVIGGAYSDDAKPWSCQDTVNYIPVMAERPGGRSPAMLRGVPGMVTFCNLGTGKPIRGARNVEGALLVVSGTGLYKVATSGAATLIGTIPGVGRVSMSHNQITGGNEVAIANGQSGYVYNTVTGTLTQITDEGFPGAISFDFIDGYITGIEPARRFAFHSNLAAATDYNTLDRYEAEGSPDKLVGQIVDHREWWLFSGRTIEPFVNTGAATNTFQRASNTMIEVGCASGAAIAQMDSSVFWVGNDGIVYRANGYTPQRISTHAIEQALAKCNLSQCFAFTFEDLGHKVYYITCPDGQTWGYDAASGEWHRRQSEGLSRWRVNTLTKWNGYWIVGDYANGKLYVLDWDVQHEAGAVLERRRVTGVLADNQNRVTVDGVALVFDTGLSGDAHSPLVPPLKIAGHLQDGRAGEAASYQYSIAGGVPARVATIVSGSLPAGLSMSASGLVTGTRTTVADYAWTIRVTDADGSVVDLPDTARTTDTLSTAILADNPVGYWKADETSGTVMADSSGHGYHGTYTVAAGVTRGAPPLRAMATASLGTNGTAVGATVPYNAALDVAKGGSTAWAMEVVTKKMPLSGTVWDQIFGAIGTINGLGLRLFYRGTGHNYAVGRTAAGDLTSPSATGGAITHLIFERNVSVCNLYENGVLVASMTAGAEQLYGDLQFLGTALFIGSYGFNGFGSDFALYSHALGATRAMVHAKAAGLA